MQLLRGRLTWKRTVLLHPPVSTPRPALDPGYRHRATPGRVLRHQRHVLLDHGLREETPVSGSLAQFPKWAIHFRPPGA
jgi:hypothetical protein